MQGRRVCIGTMLLIGLAVGLDGCGRTLEREEQTNVVCFPQETAPCLCSERLFGTRVCQSTRVWGGCQCGQPPAEECGNGTIEADEECDGADLGGATCGTRGFTGGTLGCTSTCHFDTSACTDGGGDDDPDDPGNDDEVGEFDLCRRMSDCPEPLLCVIMQDYGIQECLRPCSEERDCTGVGDRCIQLGYGEESGYCGNTVYHDGEPCNFGIDGLDFCAEDTVDGDGSYSVCMAIDDGGSNLCVRVCTMGREDQCEAGQSCHPVLRDARYGICGSSAPARAACSARELTFCEQGSWCVKLDGVAEAGTCLVECTDSDERCAADETCVRLNGRRWVCAPD